MVAMARDPWRSWRDWEPSQSTKDWLEFFGWIVAFLFGAATLTMPIWMYLLYLI